jgi:membrane protein required for colicin V production
MTYIDIALVVIMLLSGLFAMVRGFVREVLSIAAWGASAYLAYVLHPTFLPFVKDKVSNELLALGIVLFVIFIVILIVISLITSRLSDMVLYSSLGFIDRSLGFMFGLLRGFLIATIAFMIFSVMVPPESHPDWVKGSKSYAALLTTSDKIKAVLPENPTDVLKKKLEKK